MVCVPMANLDRYHARSIKNAILSENPRTFLRVDHDRLILKADNITEKQRELVNQFKDELVWYLKTPPASVAQCNNCKRPIEWICNKYGDWVCSCYRREQLLHTTTLYTFGYLKTSVKRTILELKRTECAVVDVRFKPHSSHWEWTQAALRDSLGSLYHHIPDLGNEPYKEALTGQFSEPRIKLHDVDRGLKQLKDILDRHRRAAIFCACTGKTCHRFEVATQAAAVIPELKIIHL